MRSGRVTQRCHNSPNWKRGLRSAGDVTHWKSAEDFGRFWKSKWVEIRPASGEDGWFSLARGDLCGGCYTCWEEGRWKSQYRKIVPLSLCRRTFKLKGNKKFRTWIKKSSSVFRISRSYILCIYVMNIPCTFRIFIYMAMVHQLWVK